MPLLDVWSVLIDPAWLMFGLTLGAAGLIGFLLFMVYPFSKDK